MRRGRTGWTVVFPQFGLNAHCFEAKSHRSSLKVCPNQFKALSLLRIRFSFFLWGSRRHLPPTSLRVYYEYKRQWSKSLWLFPLPPCRGTDACLSPIRSVGRPFAGPCRPPAFCNSSYRSTTSATHSRYQARNALTCGRDIQAFAVRDAALPRCRLISLKSSSALSGVGLRGRAPHGGPQSPNPSRRAPRAAEPCAPFRNCAGNAPVVRIGFCVEEAQGAFSRGRKCFSPSIYWGRTGNRDKLSRKNRDKGAAESPLRGGAPDAILCSCFPSAGGPSGRCRAEANDDSGLSRPGRQSGLTRENTGPCAPVSPPTDTKGYETRWICRPPRPRA